MKKIKYLLLVCALASCLVSCSDAEEITSENAGNIEIVEESSSEETVDLEEVVSEEEAFCGDWEVVEEWGKTPFWLKYGLQGQEVKDLSQTTLFGCMTPGATVEEILSSGEYNYFYVYPSWQDRVETSDVNEILNLQTEYPINPGDSVKISMYRSEEEVYFIDMIVYNLTDSELSVSEVLANNQYYIEEYHEGYYIDEFNAERPDLIFNLEGPFDRTYLIQMTDILGRPDIIYTGITADSLESFQERIKTGDGIPCYSMVYEEAAGKLIVEPMESNLTKTYELTQVNVVYVTNDLYTYLRDETNSGALIYEDEVFIYDQAQ